VEYFSWLEARIRPGRIRAYQSLLEREKPVLVMGRGKSGTRLVSWAISNLGVALGTAENLPAGDINHRPFRQVVKKLAQRNLGTNSLKGIHQGDLAWFQGAVFRVWRMLAQQGELALGWGWKWPETYLITPYVFKTFPNARFIHVLRDGRDVAFKNHLTDDSNRSLGKALLTRLGALGLPRYLQSAFSWQFQVERYMKFSRHIPVEQRFELKYEELCGDPVGTMERIAAFLGVPMTEACRTYVLRELTATQISQFSKQDPEKIAEVENAIGETLSALGYTLTAAG